MRSENPGAITESNKYRRLAADRGDLSAITNLFESNIIGLSGQIDDATKARYLSLIENSGNVEAAETLSADYALGLGVKADKDKALKLRTMAANAGYAKAQLMLADAYRLGTSVKKDKALACMWYHKAAAQGDETAIHKIEKYCKSDGKNSKNIEGEEGS